MNNTAEASAVTSKVFTYSQKTRCLKLFQKIEEEKDSSGYKDLYKFFLDIAGPAWELYLKWKSHQGFKGTRLKSIQRSVDSRLVEEVPDGIVFPIIAAFSAFCVQRNGRWQFVIPDSFDDKRLIRSAAADYQEVANSNPQTMGKKQACYSRLLEITNIFAEFVED